MMKRYWLVILSVFVAHSAWAQADDLTSDKTCTAIESASSCVPGKRPANNTLRGLRLHDAVQNGDLSLEEARRLAAYPNDGTPPPPPQFEHADQPRDHGKSERRFWRDQRRKALYIPAPPVE